MMLLFTILIVITSLLLILIIMVQNPKGGGLGSSFGGGGGGAQMFGGVKRTTDFLDRATWTLAIVLFALVLVINMTNTTGPVAEEGSKIQDKTESFETPAMPQSMPQQGQGQEQEMPIDISEE